MPALKELHIGIPQLYRLPKFEVPRLTHIHLEGSPPSCLDLSVPFPLLTTLEVTWLLQSEAEFPPYNPDAPLFPFLEKIVVNDQHSLAFEKGGFFLMDVMENSPKLKSVSLTVASPEASFRIFAIDNFTNLVVKELSVRFLDPPIGHPKNLKHNIAEEAHDTVRATVWDLAASSGLLEHFPLAEKISLRFETRHGGLKPKPLGFLEALSQPIGEEFCIGLEHLEFINFDIDGQLLLELSESRLAILTGEFMERFTISVSGCSNFPDVKNATHDELANTFNKYRLEQQQSMHEATASSLQLATACDLDFVAQPSCYL